MTIGIADPEMEAVPENKDYVVKFIKVGVHIAANMEDAFFKSLK